MKIRRQKQPQYPPMGAPMFYNPYYPPAYTQYGARSPIHKPKPKRKGDWLVIAWIVIFLITFLPLFIEFIKFIGWNS